MLSCVMDYSEMGAAEDEIEAWETDEDQNVAEYLEIEYSEVEGCEPKRRTRKRRWSNSTGELRRSNRGHIPVSIEKFDYIWSAQEKKNLLTAVKKYGHLDMDRLCEAVPLKSRSAIETIIIKWWRRAAVVRQYEIDNTPVFDRRFKEFRGLNKKRSKKKQPKAKLAPIEEWVQLLRKAATPSCYAETKKLAKAMLYISLFEKQPDPAECSGIDFSSLYDYLFRMLMGYPPKDLNEATIKYLLSIMEKMGAEIKRGAFHSERFHLRSVRKISLEPKRVKQYGNSKKEEDLKPTAPEDAWMKSLLEIPGYNPLSSGLSLLKLE